MSGPSSGQAPRSTTSSAPPTSLSLTADSKAVSSIAEHGEVGRWTIKGGQSSDGSPQHGDSGHMVNNHKFNVLARSQGDQQEHEFRRHRPRNSGGFLLEPTPAQRSQHGSKRHTIPGAGGDVKGKGKSEDADLQVEKRRSAHLRHGPKPSLGRSPLAMVVTNESLSNESNRSSTQDQDEIFSESSTTSERPSSRLDVDPAVSTRLRVSGDQRHLEVDPPIVSGFDMDPARIVSLALNLSESRRRTTSAGRLSPIDGVGSRRHVSAGQLSAGVGMTGGSLRQHLQPQRVTSRNISPRSITSGRVSPAPAHTGAWERPESRSRAVNATLISDSSMNDIPLDPSDATLLRAEKARISLELFYEYRRLLQYLPALPASSTSRPPTAKATAMKGVASFQELGRPYNPLQYVRNRKVRVRERKTFDAESEGWKDVDTVHDWVNTVAAERKGVTTVVDVDAPLPSFGNSGEDVNRDDASPVSSLRHPNGPRTIKQPRPRLDWMTTPWDLLADAYWVEQDANKKLIEDRDGNKIYSNSIWQKTHPPRYSRDQPPAPNDRSDSITRSFKRSESPETVPLTRGSVQQEGFVKERGRRQHKLRDSIHSVHGHSGSRERKGPWHRNLIRSRSSSSSSGGGYVVRGRKHHKQSDSRDQLDSAVFEKQMMDMLEREAESDGWGAPGGAEGAMNEEDDGSHAKEANAQNTKPTTDRRKSSPRRGSGQSAPNKPASNHAPDSTRASLEGKRGRKPMTSFEDADNTAPNSPIADGFVPSIAINLSPPESRSVSPTKKPLQSRLAAFRPSHSKERQSIGQDDFAVEVESPRNGSERDLSKRPSGDYIRKERAASPVDGLLSPKAAERFGNEVRRSDSKTMKGPREPRESESLLRGLLRGPGRIGDTVGSGVSRVGYLLWKRDNANNDFHGASTASSYASEQSDSDYESVAGDRTKNLNDPQSGTGTDDEDMARPSRNSMSNDSPKYHISNLPTFSSPFKRDEQSPRPSLEAPHDHHITRQQLAQKERGRSSRFERLAPPKMDMRSISPSPSHPLPISRTQTRERVSGPSSRGSRQSSLALSEAGMRRASPDLNPIPDLPGSYGRNGVFVPPVTGLAGLDVRRSSSQHQGLEGKRQWRISHREVSGVRGTVTRKDVARIRALLLSSGIKANEICRRAQEIRDPPLPLLQELKAIAKGPLPDVSRAQEHVLAARILVRSIDDGNGQLQSAAERLRTTTVDGLHDQIKAIDEKISSKLTPLVRACADEADAFGAELTTTHTLAVKQLNDSIDTMMRRRRRRLRWVRKGGYVLLEWTLLGIMWCVWLTVVILRLFRDAICGVVRGVKWLLWL